MTLTYPSLMSCQRGDCDWTHEALDEDDAITAWEAHALTSCPQTETPKPQPDGGLPDDPIGTIRATTGILAVHAHSANPEYLDLVWLIIDIGAGELPANVEAQLSTWPIVYQP